MRLWILTILLISAVVFTSCRYSDPDTADVPDLPEILTNVYSSMFVSASSDYEFHPYIAPCFDAENSSITWVGSQTESIPTPDGFVRKTRYYLVVSNLSGDVLSADLLPLDGSDPAYLEGGDIENGILTAGACFDSGGHRTHHIMRYNIQTKEASRSPEIDLYFTESIYIDALEVYDDLICLHTYSELLVLDAEYSLLCRIRCVSPPDDLTVSPNGIFHILADFGQGQKLYAVDIEKNSISSVFSPVGYTRQALFASDGTLYFTMSDGVYSHIGENISQVMNYKNTGADFFDTDITAILSKERFFAVERQYGSTEVLFTVFEKADDIDLSRTDVIEIAAVASTYELTDSVNFFNRTHPQVRVNIKDYSENTVTVTPEEARNALLFDITVNHYRPDIIYAHSSTEAVRQIIHGELYYDLYEFIVKDEELSKDDFLGAYVKSYEHNGTLWGMTPYVTIETLVGNASLLGEIMSWSAEKMISFALSLPEGISFTDEMTVETLEAMILGKQGYGIFVEDGTFDTDAFSDWLDLIDDLPIRPDSHQLSEEEYEEKKYADFLGRKNGKTAVTPYSIADTRDWLGVYALFDTQDAVLIGYPFESGSRSTISTGASFLITSFTSMPEEAWELVKSCCTTYSGAGGLPILKSALQSEAETYIGKTIISYFSGGSVSIETNPYRGAKNDDLTRPGRTDIFTASDAENFISFLNENAGIPIADFASAEMSAIFTEEISAYLSGIGTAEECTKKVQSRIEIWLNEQN